MESNKILEEIFPYDMSDKRNIIRAYILGVITKEEYLRRIDEYKRDRL